MKTTRGFEKAVAKFHKEMEKAEKRISKFLEDMSDSADIMHSCVEDINAIQTCTRLSPHVCKSRGPCNGWPRY